MKQGWVDAATKLGRLRRGIWLALPLTLLLGCSEDEASRSMPEAPASSTAGAPAKTPESAAPDHASLVQRGKVVYATNCTACHNPNPAQDGALGPAVTGSSRELIDKRVLQGTYPDGYEPKRTSRVMIALPHLKPDIAALTAYLNE